MPLLDQIDQLVIEAGEMMTDPRFADTNMLRFIVSSLMRMNNITVRIAVYLNEADLRDIFLAGARRGGRGDASETLELVDSDEELERIANNFSSNAVANDDTRIRKISPITSGMFKFSQLIDTTGITHSPSDVALINLPKQVFEKIKQAAVDVSTPEKKENFRKQLALMFNYKYYLMSLDLNECKKIAAKMNTAKNEDRWVEIFNPFRVIKNYPDKSKLDAAKIVWNETQNPDITGEKETKSLEQQADRAERAREAAKKTMGSANDLENIVLSSVLSAANAATEFNPTKVALGLKNILKNTYSKNDISSTLEKLSRLGSPKIQQVKDVIDKMVAW